LSIPNIDTNVTNNAGDTARDIAKRSGPFEVLWQ